MKKFLSLVLALVMAMSLVTVSAGAKDFTDSDSISGEDYAEAIDVMSALQIIDGYEGGAFQPQGTLTRGAAAKIIACMMLGKTTAESLGNQAAPFKDVPAGSTFAGYIAYCVETGIVDGYADGTFRPSNKLTGFAFLKMLLTAMGYDSGVEGFTGTNWTVNVARLAIENGLTDGNDEFVGTQLATREEACLYAVNTLKATLVEYESKGSQITINGAVISSGATNAKPVTTKVVSTQTINSAKTVDGEWTVEFAEKYQPKLVLTGKSDAFCRPANVWTYKDKEVGTYTKAADLTYTEKVTSGTVYADLGLTETKTVTEYYEDGVQQSPVLLEKGNTVSANKVGAQGTETTVYYNTTTGVVTICEVNTYVADVAAKYAATANKAAYITLATRETNYATVPGASDPYASLVNFSSKNTFETTDFEVDDIVLFTYSNKTGDVGVQSVKAAETVTGTLTNYTTNKQAVVGGTTYKYAEKIATQADSAFLNKNVDAVVVLDSYGNAIDITDNGVQNYAVVLKLKTNADIWNDTHMAKLLLTDGTTADVNLTNSNNNNAVTDKVYSGTATSGVTIDVGDIVSYTVNNKDKYTLTKLAEDDATELSIENGRASVTGATKYQVAAATEADTANDRGTTYTANGKTIFLVKSGTAANPIYNAYTGIKAVPTITRTANVTNAVYCKTSGIATVVYVDTIDTAVLSTNDVIFVQSDGTPKTTVDTVSGTYYVYDAIVNGEITKINATNLITTNTLFDSVSYETYDNGVKVATLANGVWNASGHYGTITLGNGIMVASGSDKLTNGAIGLGSTWYVPADSCKVFYIDSDKTIQTSSIGAIAKDTNDVVYFKSVNGEITYIIVDAQPKNSGNRPVVDPAIQIVNSDAGNGYANPTFYIADGSALTAMQMRAKLMERMVADGCSNISWNNNNVTFTKAGYTYTSTVAVAQTYKLTVGPNTYYLAAGKAVTAANGALDLTGPNVKVTKVADSSVTYPSATGYTMPAYDIVLDDAYVPTTNMSGVTNDTSNTIFGTTFSYVVNNGTAAASLPTYVKVGDTVKVTLTVAAATTDMNGNSNDASLTATGATAAVWTLTNGTALKPNFSAGKLSFAPDAAANLVAGDTITFTFTVSGVSFAPAVSYTAAA